MKNLIHHIWIAIFIFCTSLLLGQGLNFETGYNNFYDQSADAVLSVGDHSYMAYVEESSNSYSDGYLLKYDSLGNVLWSENVVSGGSLFLKISALLPAQDGGVYVCGSGRLQCEIDEFFVFVNKISTDGELIWENVLEDSSTDQIQTYISYASGFSLVDDHVVFGLGGTLMDDVESDTFNALISYNDQGELIDSLSIDESYLEGFVSLDGTGYVAYSEQTIFKYNQLGEMSQFTQMNNYIRGLMVVEDEYYVLLPGLLMVLNSNLVEENSYTISGSSDLYHLKMFNDQVSFISGGSWQSSIITFDENFQTNTIATIPVEVNLWNHFDYSGTHFDFAENFMLTEKAGVRYRNFSLSDTDDASVNTTDIALINVAGNDLIVLNETTENTFNVEVDVSVLIKNNGTNTLNSARLNKNITWGICSPYYFSQEYDDLNIEPGDSLWINIGLIWLEGVEILPGANEVELEMCIYSSHPNSLTDLNVENDEVCEVLNLSYVGIDEVRKEELRIYPNPTQDFVFVDLSEEELLSYEIFGVDGTLIRVGSLSQNLIDLSDVTPGLYFVRFINENGTPVYSNTVVKY